MEPTPDQDLRHNAGDGVRLAEPEMEPTPDYVVCIAHQPSLRRLAEPEMEPTPDAD